MATENHADVLADLGAVQKNGMGEQIRVRLVSWRGHPCIDVRVFVPTANGDFKATRKGISLPVKKVQDVLHLVQAGIAEAARLSLVSDQQSQSHVSRSRAASRETRQPEKRTEAHRMREGGMSPEEIAEWLDVSRATVYRWLKEELDFNAQNAGTESEQPPAG